jgi:hypothetical protein
MLTATACDKHAEQLFDRIRQLHSLLTEAGVPYRIVGGMAVFFHVFEKDPLQARLTPNPDVAIERADLTTVVEVGRKAGLDYRDAAGLDMLIDAEHPGTRSAVRLLFVNETVPASLPVRTSEGIWVAPVADLVRMKLTSYRLKDRVHIQDLDGVGLIGPEIEAQLPRMLRDRLAEIRASE